MEKKNGAIMVMCDCKHDFQDKTYGKGKRVANLKAEGKKAKCTVCGKEFDSVYFIN